MRILFITSNQVSEYIGGTERITALLSNELTSRGHVCFSGYEIEEEKDSHIAKFEEQFNMRECDTLRFIADRKINCVILQLFSRMAKRLDDYRKENNLNFKIISVLHYSVEYQRQALNLHLFTEFIRQRKCWHETAKDIVRLLTYPIYKRLFSKRDQNLYKVVYTHSDKTVLLSKTFISDFCNYAKIKEQAKLRIINNPLTFNEYANDRDLAKKKKQVLIVSRLEEYQKHLSIALKMWAEIEKDKKLSDWKLIIVGDGDDASLYRKMAIELGLHNVEFCGIQEPSSLYKESPILIFTSKFEGWGLTLTEAQQFGCVPIAFNTYSSLTDIITHGENGFIIKPWDTNEYIKQLKELMINGHLAMKIGLNCIESSKRFSSDRIMTEWEKLLNE